MILQKLRELATASTSEDLDFVYFQYSGHGSSVADQTGDERDGRDETLIGSDFRTIGAGGIITDDALLSAMHDFNPATRVVCVLDACHSGTGLDLRFSWEGTRSATIENLGCTTKARIISLSGSLDSGTSADVYNMNRDEKYGGALTNCMLKVLHEKGNLDSFALLAAVRLKLKERGFAQVPKLCSSFNLAKDDAFFP
jgi:hypothetical protein